MFAPRFSTPNATLTALVTATLAAATFAPTTASAWDGHGDRRSSTSISITIGGRPCPPPRPVYVCPPPPPRLIVRPVACPPPRPVYVCPPPPPVYVCPPPRPVYVCPPRRPVVVRPVCEPRYGHPRPPHHVRYDDHQPRYRHDDGPRYSTFDDRSGRVYAEGSSGYDAGFMRTQDDAREDRWSNQSTEQWTPDRSGDERASPYARQNDGYGGRDMQEQTFANDWRNGQQEALNERFGRTVEFEPNAGYQGDTDSGRNDWGQQRGGYDGGAWNRETTSMPVGYDGGQFGGGYNAGAFDGGQQAGWR